MATDGPVRTVATPAPTIRSVQLPDGISLTVQEFGTNTQDSAVLVLHAGSGPSTISAIAAALSAHAYVLMPTHPGFDGTARPQSLDSVADLSTAYLDLLDVLDLTGVMVIGNSVGGWIASEMALRDNHQRIGSLVLLNACGIHTHRREDQIVDVRMFDPPGLSKLSFATQQFRPDFASFTTAQRAAAAANQQTLAIYGGEHFVFDPKLRGRLHRVTLPVLVVWGEQDKIAPLGYGRDYAQCFPHGHFAPIANAGHFPQLEQLAATLEAICDFVDGVVAPSVPG